MTELTFRRADKPAWITGRKYYQLYLEVADAAADPNTGECDAVLVREPENEFDTNAVRVDIGGHKCGYIPGKKAAVMAPLLDAEGVTQLKCRVCIFPPSSKRTMYGAQLLGIYR